MLTSLESPEGLRRPICVNNPIENSTVDKKGAEDADSVRDEEALKSDRLTMSFLFNNGIDARKAHGWRTILDPMDK